MGPPEAPQAVSVGLRNCYLALPKRHKLFLSILGFETAIWHLFSTLKSLKTLPAAFDGLSLLFRGATSCFYWASKLLSGTLQLSTAFRCFAMGPPEAPQAVCCFYWASKLLSGPSEAPQDVSIGLRNCYLARFQHPLKASKPSKPSQQLSTAFHCFAMGPPEAPRAVSVGLRNCYLTLPKRHKLFLLGFETAIWHVFSTP